MILMLIAFLSVCPERKTLKEKPSEPEQPEKYTRETEIDEALDSAMTTMHTVTILE